MELTSNDFDAYAQSTGTPYPRNAAEKAALAPQVLAFKREMLEQRSRASEQPEERNALATAGLAALVAGGAGLAGYGAYQGLRSRSTPAGPAPGAAGVPGASGPGPGPGGAPGAPASSPVEVDPAYPEAYRATRRNPGGRRPGPSTRRAPGSLHPGPATLQLANKSGVIAAADERGLYEPGKNPLEHPVLGPKIAAALAETDPGTQAAMLARLEQEVRISGSRDLQATWKQLVRQVAQGAASRHAIGYEPGNPKDRTLARIQGAWEASGKDWQSGVDLDDPGRGDPGRESTEPGTEVKETAFRVKSKSGRTRTGRFPLGARELQDDVYGARNPEGRNWEPILGKGRQDSGSLLNTIAGDQQAEANSIAVPFNRSWDKSGYQTVFREGEAGENGNTKTERVSVTTIGSLPPGMEEHYVPARDVQGDRRVEAMPSGYRVRIGDLNPEAVLQPGTRFYTAKQHALQENRSPLRGPGTERLSTAERTIRLAENARAEESSEPAFKLGGKDGRELTERVRPAGGYRGVTQGELAKQAPAPDNDFNYRTVAGRTVRDEKLLELLGSAGHNPHKYGDTESFQRQLDASIRYRVDNLGSGRTERTFNKARAWVVNNQKAEASRALASTLASLPQALGGAASEADEAVTAGAVARLYGLGEESVIDVMRGAKAIGSSKTPPRPLDLSSVVTHGAVGAGVQADVTTQRVRLHNENLDILPGQQREAVTNPALAAARQVREIVKANPAYRQDQKRLWEQISVQGAAFGADPLEVVGALRGLRDAENYQVPTEKGSSPAPAGYSTAPDSKYGPFEDKWGGQVFEAFTRAPVLGVAEAQTAALSGTREGVRELAYSALQNVPQFLGITRNQDGEYEVNQKLASEKGLAPISDLDATDQMSVVGEALTAAANDYAEAVDLARNSDDPLLREAGERVYAGGLKGSNEFEQFATPYVKEYVQLRALLNANNDPDRPARLRIPKGSSEILALRALSEGRSFDDVLNEGIRGSETLADGVLDLMAPTAHINAGLPPDFGGQMGQEARSYGDLLQINHRRRGSATSAMGTLKQQVSEAQMNADPSRKGAPVRGIQIMLTPGFEENRLMSNRQGIEHELMAERFYSPMIKGFGDPDAPDENFSRNVVRKPRVDTTIMGSTLKTIIGELDNRNYRLKHPVEGRQPPENLAAELENNQRLLDQHKNMLNLLESHPVAVHLAISDYNTGGKPNPATGVAGVGADDLPMLGFDSRSGRPVVQRVERRSGMQSIDQGERGYDTWMGNQGTIAEQGREAAAPLEEVVPDVADSPSRAPAAPGGFDPLNDEHLRQLDVAIERHRGEGGDAAMLPVLEQLKARTVAQRADPSFQGEPEPTGMGRMPEIAPQPGGNRPDYTARRADRQTRQQNARRILMSLGGPRDRPQPDRTSRPDALVALNRSAAGLESAVHAAEEGTGRMPPELQQEALPLHFGERPAPVAQATNPYVAGVSAPTPRPVPTTNEIPRGTVTQGGAAGAVRQQVEARRQGSQMPASVPSRESRADPGYMGGMDTHREAAQMASFWDAMVARGLAPAAPGEAAGPVTPFRKLIGRELDARAQEMVQADLDRGIPLRASAPPEQEAVGVLVREPWNRWRRR